MELRKWGEEEDLCPRHGPGVKILHGDQTFDGKTSVESGPRTAMANRRAWGYMAHISHAKTSENTETPSGMTS